MILLIEIIMFVTGATLLAYSSTKTVKFVGEFAKILGVSPLVISLLIVSVGTSLPEFSNSIISSATGHGDINVGDTFGSTLSQITLILALAAFIGGRIKTKRGSVVVIGSCMIVAILLALIVAWDGVISRIDAFFLIVSYIVLMLISQAYSARKYIIRSLVLSLKEKFFYYFGRLRPRAKRVKIDRKFLLCFFSLVLSLFGVVAGSSLLINSVVSLSKKVGGGEYIISFFLMAIGTSLPELSVTVAAALKKRHEIVIGDLLGSNITDATIGLGIGPLISPIVISKGLTTITGLYTLFASFLVIILLALRKKVDRKVGMVLLSLYLLSYAIPLVVG